MSDRPLDKDGLPIHRILHLGAGVQSSAIYCLSADGEVPRVDAAVFSDTQEEPYWVYDQLEILEEYRKQTDGPPIHIVTAGKIGDDLMRGRNKLGGRFASIPSHTTEVEGEPRGITRRQCTKEYKIEPITEWMRRGYLKMAPRKHFPKDLTVWHQFGFSTDEPKRAARIRGRFDQVRNQEVEFPLLDEEILMTRLDCVNYLDKKFPGVTFRSSRCVFCPYQTNKLWKEIRDHDPEGWKRAIEVDKGLRTTGAVANRKMNEKMYVHRSCIPLEEVDLDGEDARQLELFDLTCDAACAT